MGRPGVKMGKTRTYRRKNVLVCQLLSLFAQACVDFHSANKIRLQPPFKKQSSLISCTGEGLFLSHSSPQRAKVCGLCLKHTPVGKGRAKKEEEGQRVLFPDQSSSYLAPRPQNASKTGPGHGEEGLLVIFKGALLSGSHGSGTRAAAPSVL